METKELEVAEQVETPGPLQRRLIQEKASGERGGCRVVALMVRTMLLVAPKMHTDLVKEGKVVVVM